MTNKEAADRIREHNRIHQQKEPRAILITEALEMAADLLERTPDMKPMTMEEALQSKRPVYGEHKISEDSISQKEKGIEWISPISLLMLRAVFDDLMWDSGHIRFWPERPTPEQSEEWPWEA